MEVVEMICCVHKIDPDCSSLDHMTIDLDTGELIDDCKWSNDVTGEYCIYPRGADGKILREWANPSFRHLPIENWRTHANVTAGGIRAKTEIRRGNIKIVKVKSMKDLHGNILMEVV